MSTNDVSIKEISNHSLTYYQEGIADMDAWFQVADKDYDELIRGFHFNEFFLSLPQPISLLDIGCGTGKFPAMLQSTLDETLQINYDYLDPAEYCLEAMAKTIDSPYRPNLSFHTPIETLDIAGKNLVGKYDFIWSIHAVSNWSHVILEDGLKIMQRLLKSDSGIAIIFILSESSFYNRIYNLYRMEFQNHVVEPFILGEDIMQILDTLGIHYKCKRLHYHHKIDVRKRNLLQKYLEKCTFDNLTLEQWFTNPTTNRFLASFQNGSNYCFPQIADILIFSSSDQDTEFIDSFLM